MAMVAATAVKPKPTVGPMPVKPEYAKPKAAPVEERRSFIATMMGSMLGVGFVALAPVHWIAVWPLGLGCLIGARLGPIVVRHAPATPLRLAIAVAGLALAAKLGYDAYR